ncbi:MAG: hypothetical protein ABSG43_10420 [Solirubrobacteraceae bacterium]
MTETLEHTARRIAERGREALIERLRPAFEQAVARHADVLQLDPDQLDELVERAADRADGLQWRRALASVAIEELGIGLTDALAHPAVARAQTIIGAPSYEDSLAKLTPIEAESPRRREPEGEPERALPVPAAPASPTAPAPSRVARAPASTTAATAVAPAPFVGAESQPAPQHSSEPAGQHLPQPADRQLPVPAGQRLPEPVLAVDPAGSEARVPGDEEWIVTLPAIHIGGVANLTPTESEIELRISDAGLQFVRSGHVFERLSWDQIRGVEVHDSRRLRRRGHGAQLLLRSEHGEASFEIRGIAPKELREQLRPLLAHR